MKEKFGNEMEIESEVENYVRSGMSWKTFQTKRKS